MKDGSVKLYCGKIPVVLLKVVLLLLGSVEFTTSSGVAVAAGSVMVELVAVALAAVEFRP